MKEGRRFRLSFRMQQCMSVRLNSTKRARGTGQSEGSGAHGANLCASECMCEGEDHAA
jgi:hypothetical protein